MSWMEDLVSRALQDEYLNELIIKLEMKYGYNFFMVAMQIELSDKEYYDILRFADILCRSERAEARNKAYKIMTLLYDEYKEDIQFRYCSNTVFTKLGNFPAINLTIGETETYDTTEVALEKAVKKTYQEAPQEGMFFTDMQYKLFEQLKNNNHFSFSGPTSFGKSFVMEAFIQYIVSERHGIDNVVILVPTRALINQVVSKLRDQIQNDKYKILSHPALPVILKNKNFKYIFVFTPERWIAYLAEKNNPAITYMFIDEAHKIIAQKDSRAPLYYHAILLAERKSIKLYFASPNVPNADVFLELFEKSTEEKMIIQEAPVAQNRFFVDFIDNKVVMFSDIGNEIVLPIKLTKEQRYLGKIIERLGEDSKNIIYCNTIEDTISFAIGFARHLPEKKDERIDLLIEMIKKYIHKEYYLIDCLKKGVAFHFGRLPQRVREQVERLFSDKVIDYIFCTSTLLEGVNLPAKNIFILNNAIGSRKFSDIDFWNLAGRAGRLNKELCGNIICIRAEDKKNRWDNPQKDLEVVRNKKINKVEPTIIKGEKNFYQNIGKSLENKDFTRKQPTQIEKDIWNHYANILFVHEISKDDSILVSNFLKKNISANQILNKVEKENQIPINVLEQCSMIKPYYQNYIWNQVKEKRAFPDEVTVENCQRVLKELYQYYNWEQEESGGHNPLVRDEARLSYFTVLIYTWMKETPLNLIISNLIRYYTNKGIIWNRNEYGRFDNRNRAHINLIINNIIADIDNVLRFKLKNYFLNYYLIVLNKYGKDVAGDNWADYLEYGTTNPLTIEIQNIGLPRHIATIIIEEYSECLIVEQGEITDFDSELLRTTMDKEVYKDEYEELKTIFKWD